MQTSLRLFLSSVSVIFLSACGGVTPVSPKDLPISTITPTIQAQNTVTAQPTAEAKDRIYDISVSRDEKNFAVFTSKGIYVYDSVTFMQKQFMKIKVSSQGYHLFSPSITFTPDGSKLIFSGENWIASWDLLNNKENNIVYLSTSAIPGWNISQIEYSPKGDRIIVTTHGDYDRCDGTGINFALYDIKFNLLFDRYFCTVNSETYYRFTSDDRVYIFYNARSMFFPFEFYNVELSSGNVTEKIEYDPYSGNAENFIYDVSPDGQLLAVGNYSNYQFSTRIVNTNSGNVIQELDGGTDLSLDGIGKLRKSNLNEIVNEKCGIINKPNEGKQYTILTSNDLNVVFTVSDWYPFADWKDVKSLELWNLSSCEIEKTIIFP
jgi:WD40 repeat protein